MPTFHHINCGSLATPLGPAACHCVLIEHAGRLALVDTGIGLLDCRSPVERLGQGLIDAAGFRFDEADTAVRRIETLGFSPADVTDIVLTHADPDHTGGLADFPNARVHVSAEEKSALDSGDPRYLPVQFAHGPRWAMYPPSASGAGEWFGLDVRAVDLAVDVEALLVPLPGHTLGHCGVAVRDGGRWLLHVGDAYYLRAELTTDDHPVSGLAAARAADDARRRESLVLVRRLHREHADAVTMFGYHDGTELPDPRG